MDGKHYQLRPRYAGLSYLALAVSISFGVLALSFNLSPQVRNVALGICVVGLGLAVAYQLSPVRRLQVVVSPQGIGLQSGEHQRFFLPWSQVKQVIASPQTSTCYVDGGSSEHSIIVPGVGAPAPYDIVNKLELYKEILRYTPESAIRYVESLETSKEPCSDAIEDG